MIIITFSDIDKPYRVVTSVVTSVITSISFFSFYARSIYGIAPLNSHMSNHIPHYGRSEITVVDNRRHYAIILTNSTDLVI
jgi:hypothetical protein